MKKIRRAQKSEAMILKDLALRSKATWGYSQEFMNKCVDYFVLTENVLSNSITYVYEESGSVLGFYSLLKREKNVMFLDYFFVDVHAQGKGIGQQLWIHMVNELCKTHTYKLIIEADQHAVEFYKKRGAFVIEIYPSTLDETYNVIILELMIEHLPEISNEKDCLAE